MANATLGLDFDPFGCPRRLGESAGPRLPSGTWQRCSPRIPHAYANCEGPGAIGAFSSLEDGNANGILWSNFMYGLQSTSSIDSIEETSALTANSGLSSGAHGRQTSFSLVKRGGRFEDEGSGGAEQ